jgi:hypothetical protein
VPNKAVNPSGGPRVFTNQRFLAAAGLPWSLASGKAESTMKFVHLTSQPNIARVRRSGIRCGNGRRGRGVYAVPLMMMQRVTFIDDDTIVPASPRSSTTLWQWLAGLKNRHRNLAAIVFRTSPNHWPADLYLELKAATGTAWLANIDAKDATVASNDLDFVRDVHNHSFIADLKLSVQNAAGLGKILNAIQSHGHTTWDRFDESIEIIFPNAIASNLIDDVTPLYRTNKQFRQHRERQQDTG